MITSKNVSPYKFWRIESKLTTFRSADNSVAKDEKSGVGKDEKNRYPLTEFEYLGRLPFDVKLFPGYKIQNVSRDSHV